LNSARFSVYLDWSLGADTRGRVRDINAALMVCVDLCFFDYW